MRLFLVGIAAFSIAACGSSSPSSSATPAELRGTYVASTPGAIVQIVFLDGTREEVTWASCGGGRSCTRAGSYALNDAESELTLTDALTQDVTTLAFQALSAAPTPEALQVLGTSLTNGGGTLTSGGSGSLTGDGGVPLVTTFQAGSGAGAQQLNNDGPDPTEPQANQANTPSSPYDCVGGVCMYDDTSLWEQSASLDLSGSLKAETR